MELDIALPFIKSRLHRCLCGTRRNWPVSFFEVRAVLVLLKMFKKSWRVFLFVSNSRIPEPTVGFSSSCRTVFSAGNTQLSGKTRGHSCCPPKHASGRRSCGSFFSGSCGSQRHASCGFLRTTLTSSVCPLGVLALHFGLHFKKSSLYSHVEIQNDPVRQPSLLFRRLGTRGTSLKCGDWLTDSLVGLLGPRSEFTFKWLLVIWVFKSGLSFSPFLGTKEAVVLR